jgi:hypothetical protein
MDRKETLDRTADVYTAWENKYINQPGFDADNPTPEQEREYYSALTKAGVPIGGAGWQEDLAKMTPEQLAFIRKSQEELPE